MFSITFDPYSFKGVIAIPHSPLCHPRYSNIESSDCTRQVEYDSRLLDRELGEENGVLCLRHLPNNSRVEMAAALKVPHAHRVSPEPPARIGATFKERLRRSYVNRIVQHIEPQNLSIMYNVRICDRPIGRAPCVLARLYPGLSRGVVDGMTGP